jgi:hypothetical protein
MSADSSFRFFRLYGDRTSSLISFYPHFSSFLLPGGLGEIRYLETASVVAAANEPLGPEDKKKQMMLSFFADPRFQKKTRLALPISGKLAGELKEAGLSVWQVGAEPIFTLRDYFSDPMALLKSFPIAMSLKRRGAGIKEILPQELNHYQDRIQELTEDWLSRKKLAPLGFLNAVVPMALKEEKRYFALFDRNQVSAVLTACPMYQDLRISGYFLNDVLVSASARSATSELLIIETMRTLHEEGVREVRLGMSPLAALLPGERDHRKLTWLFEKWRLGYNFKTLHQFKLKMKPTSWQPLYLASSCDSFFKMIRMVSALHLSPDFFMEFVKRNRLVFKGGLVLRNAVKPLPMPKEERLSVHLFRLKWTLSFFALFVSLHVLKVLTRFGQNGYDHSGYDPGNVTWLGVFIGPLFHNHGFHLFGDQLSFLIFGGALEYIFGAKLFLIVSALGLWMSNPFSHALLYLTLKPFSPSLWGHVLGEVDYGSSNAVFSQVGAWLYCLKKNGPLLWPFFFYALFICLERESLLAIHHFVGILLGLIAAMIYFAGTKDPSM